MLNNPDEKSFQNSLITFFKNNLNYEYKDNLTLIEENLRKNEKEFLLKPILKESLLKINNGKNENQINQAIFAIEKITDPDLVSANKKFYNLIKNGIDTFNEKTKSYQKVFLFDKVNFLNNHFLVVDEFKFAGNKNKRCDLVVFLNGIPISIIELKNPYDEKATIDKAYNQIKTYQEDINNLFITNCFNSISNDFQNGAGTITSNLERYTEFKDEFGNKSLGNHFKGLYSKENLIKIIFDYIIFTQDKIKIITSYHQFFCVEKIIQKATLVNENNQTQVGVVWHTTGSGKSFTMAFTAKQLIEKLTPLIIVVTDRVDLDNQLFNTFANASEFLNVNLGLKKIQSRKDLIKNLDKNRKSEVIFTTIQKFLKDENKLNFDELSTRKDIFVIVDEAHRSHYDLRDGLAKNLRDALPKAKFLGFTGTPIELEDKNTKLIFGNYIDTYKINRAVEDKTTVPINYEPRLAKIGLKEEQIVKLDEKVEKLFSLTETNEKDKKFLKMESVIGDEKRLELLAKDFIKHYQKRFEYIDGKVLFACISRKVAVKFYEILKKLKSNWFDKDDQKGQIKIVMSGGSSDLKNFQEHIRSKEKLKEIEKRFKNENNDLKIVIVANMWLTGFDVPCLNTLYIDKPIKDHNLIQAISRVNRVYPNKDSGLIVDYIGIGEFLKRAIHNFSEDDKKEIEIDFEKTIKLLLEFYELTKSCFNGFDYSDYFRIENKAKRDEIIKDGIDKILGEKKYKKDFLLNSLKLLKTYSLCPLSDEAKKIVNEINYFKLVRIGLLQLKNTNKTQNNKLTLEKELSILVSRSIEPKGVVDIYKFVGIEKPEISILSEEFFEEIRNLKQKNLAYELLKKLLQDKIKLITKGNVVLEKKFSEKLKELVNQYENKTLESAKIIEEMISMSTDIDKDFKQKKDLGLNEDEIKFYYAVAQINDKEEVMKVEILKDLTQELVEQIRKNKTIDWNKRENTRAKMRLMIKRLLKKYGYPPKDRKEARDLVLKQAEIFCESMT